MEIIKIIDRYFLFIVFILFFFTWSLSIVYSYSFDPILSLNTLAMGFGILLILTYVQLKCKKGE